MRGSEFINATVRKPEATTKLGVAVADIELTNTAATVSATVPRVPNQFIVREGPPPNAPTEGTWVLGQKYIGPETKQRACLGCLCCDLPALCILQCPVR